MSSEPILGEIMLVGFNFAPRGWTFCEGQLLPISQNSALFSLLGTAFGGDGRTTFGLPDLRGRVPFGVGTGPGLSSIQWGGKLGAETTTLGTHNLPPHSHTATARASSASANSGDPQGNVWAAEAGGVTFIYTDKSPDTSMSDNAIDVASAGDGIPFYHRPPGLGLHWAIAVTGVYPTRE